MKKSGALSDFNQDYHGFWTTTGFDHKNEESCPKQSDDECRTCKDNKIYCDDQVKVEAVNDETDNGTVNRVDNGTENETDNGTGDGTDNGIENGTDNKTDNGTGSTTNNGTENGTNNETDNKTDNGTENGTDNGTGNGTDNGKDTEADSKDKTLVHSCNAPDGTVEIDAEIYDPSTTIPEVFVVDPNDNRKEGFKI